MSTIVSTPESNEPKMALNFKFRWAVHQIGQNEVEMLVPIGSNGMFRLDWNPQAVKTLELTKLDLERAHEEAVEAAVRAIAIVK